MIQVALCGAAGRMGVEITRALREAPDLRLVLAVEHGEHPVLREPPGAVAWTDDLARDFGDTEVIVDFSPPRAVMRHLSIAVSRATPFVTGTTGFADEEQAALRAAGERIPLVWASNMSRGIAVAGDLLSQAVSRLSDYDVEIVEMHHRRKRDAPSGTALRLAEIIQSARGRVGELGIHALRGGDAVGEHHVILAGPGERLVVTHIADSRGAFVAGVLAAIRFLEHRSPGCYDMNDVLGIRSSCRSGPA